MNKTVTTRDGDPIHPKLATTYRGLTIGGKVVVVLVPVIFLAFAFFAYSGLVPDRPGAPGRQGTMILIMALVTSVIFFTVPFVLNLQKKRVTAISKAMSAVTPKPMLMRLSGVTDLKGALAELHNPGAQESDRAWGVASLRGFSRGLPSGKGMQPIRYYHTAHLGGEELVIETDPATTIYTPSV